MVKRILHFVFVSIGICKELSSNPYIIAATSNDWCNNLKEFSMDQIMFRHAENQF